MVLISGEPGIGKSRLTAVLSEHIESEPHTRLRYFCAPHHQHSVLYPFIAQLERAAGFTRDDTVDGQLLLSLDDHLAAAGALNRRRLALRKSDGLRPWTEDDVDAYEKRMADRHAATRVARRVALHRASPGDAVQLGRQHVRDGVASLTTEKTGTLVTLPILPVLAATLKAGPCGDLTFIAGANGRPFTKESFGNDFRQACRAAGEPGSAHGVRKIAATRAANAGATVAQLEAIFGWSGGVMASRRVAVLQPEYLRRNVGRNVLDVGRIHVSRRLRRLQFPTSPTTPPTPLATDH